MCKLRSVSIALISLGFIYTPLLLADGDFESGTATATEITSDESPATEKSECEKIEAQCEKVEGPAKEECNKEKELVKKRAEC